VFYSPVNRGGSESVTGIFRAFFIEQHRETLIDLGDRRIVVRIVELCK
jgi:hypothetical protein